MEVKASFSDDRIKLYETAPLDTPLRLMIDPSEVCNLKCSYCFRSQNIKEYGYALKNDIMSMDIFYKIVEQIKEFPQMPKTITLTGAGEPLANKNIPLMITHIKENFDCKIDIITNAVLLSEEYAIKLAESKIDKVLVSLQGLTGDKYKEVCGKSIDMDKFISNLKVLYDNSTNTKIFVKIADIALDEGDEDKFYEMFKYCCHYAYVDTILDLWTNLEGDNTVDGNLDVNRFGLKIPYQNCCSPSFYSLNIIPNGDAYPCCNPLFTPNFGNINDISLLDIWNGKKRSNFLKAQLKNGRKSIPVCKECNFAQGINDLENDSLNGHEEKIKKRMESYYGN